MTPHIAMTIPDPIRSEVDDLLLSSRVIDAVKLVRVAADCNLSEAHAAVSRREVALGVRSARQGAFDACVGIKGRDEHRAAYDAALRERLDALRRVHGVKDGLGS